MTELGAAGIYRFLPSTRCNMCGAEEALQKIVGRRLNTHQGLWPRTKHGVSVSIARCRRCGLVYPKPMPIPVSLDAHYDVDATEYWNDHIPSVSDFGALVSAFNRRWRGASDACRVLDVGAGVGAGMRALEQAGFSVYGIEPSPTFRDVALRNQGIAPERLQLASVETASFPEASFDWIVFSAVLEHLPDPSVALERALSWLAPGGLIYVEVPSSRWLLSRCLRAYYRLIGTEYVANTSPMHIPYHLFEFDLTSFIRNGERIGYQIVDSEVFVCDTYAHPLVDPLLTAIMRVTNTGMQLTVWLTHRDHAETKKLLQ